MYLYLLLTLCTALALVLMHSHYRLLHMYLHWCTYTYKSAHVLAPVHIFFTSVNGLKFGAQVPTLVHMYWATDPGDGRHTLIFQFSHSVFDILTFSLFLILKLFD